jgi:hypothetical protein
VARAQMSTATYGTSLVLYGLGRSVPLEMSDVGSERQQPLPMSGESRGEKDLCQTPFAEKMTFCKIARR